MLYHISQQIVIWIETKMALRRFVSYHNRSDAILYLTSQVEGSFQQIVAGFFNE